MTGTAQTRQMRRKRIGIIGGLAALITAGAIGWYAIGGNDDLMGGGHGYKDHVYDTDAIAAWNIDAAVVYDASVIADASTVDASGS